MPSFQCSADSEIDSQALLEEGARLSKGKANRLLKELEADPDNPELRIKLLGYYGQQHCRNDEVTTAFAEHRMWLVKHYPRDSVHEWLFPMMVNNPQFRAVKREWLRQIRLAPSDAAILNNAAHFCQWVCHKQAEEFWLKAHEQDPMNDDFLRELSALNERRCRYTGSKRAAQKTVRYYISALDVHDTDPKNSYLCSYVEMIGTEIGDMLIQYEFADLAIEVGQRMVRAGDWPVKIYDDSGTPSIKYARRSARHHGHSLVGLGYFMKGKTELALAELEQMTKLPMPYGPDLTLAARLVRAGECDTVKTYLASCIRIFESQLNALKHTERDPDQIRTKGIGFATHSEGEKAKLQAKCQAGKKWLDKLSSGRQPRIPEGRWW